MLTRLHTPLLRIGIFCLLVNGIACTFAATAVCAVICQPLCSVQCLKPLTLYDRWDDTTLIAGYLAWSGNGQFDQEAYSDANGNGRRDPGEPFTDANLNGVFDQEFYDPQTTGYTAAIDLGMTIGSQQSPMWPLSLPGTPRALPEIDAYAQNLEGCNATLISIGDVIPLEQGLVLGTTRQILQDKIALDPNAAWDSGCECVQNSAFEEGPRILILPLADPRVTLGAGALYFQVAQLAAFFLEGVDGAGNITLRFCKTTQSVGEVCSGQPDAGFVRHCDEGSQAVEYTWGRAKAAYR